MRVELDRSVPDNPKVIDRVRETDNRASVPFDIYGPSVRVHFVLNESKKVAIDVPPLELLELRARLGEIAPEFAGYDVRVTGTAIALATVVDPGENISRLPGEVWVTMPTIVQTCLWRDPDEKVKRWQILFHSAKQLLSGQHINV